MKSGIERLIGNVLYAYGLLWLWLFRMTPAKWIVQGCCGGRNDIRGKWGRYVTSQLGWTRNWRYETRLIKRNKEVAA